MTSNDAQIDVLLRRYAGQSQGTAATEHLDADEINAFAEGSLPAAARSRYISHLVDCDNCRQIVSQLAISSGALIPTAAETTADVQGYTWWKRLSGFFSPLTLRYAAFAMVLIAAAGVVFLVIRRPREPNLVAQTEQNERAPESVVKAPNDALPQTTGQSGANENKQSSATSPAPTPSSDRIAGLDQPKYEDRGASSLKPAKEADALSTPSLAASKKAEPGVTEPVPSYAPPPPGEGQRAQTESREEQKIGGVASASGPRKSAPADKFKMMDQERATVAGKDNRAADDNSRLAANQPLASRRVVDEKAKGPRRDAENNVRNRNSNAVQNDATDTQGTVTTDRAASEEKPPETRSAGGRKFRRQGNTWIDTKFKSSMTLKSISRGSSDFSDLDSGLRSIAQQLGGEVIVVWKSKAYQIR
jgi:hypothetical protein